GGANQQCDGGSAEDQMVLVENRLLDLQRVEGELGREVWIETRQWRQEVRGGAMKFPQPKARDQRETDQHADESHDDQERRSRTALRLPYCVQQRRADRRDLDAEP